MIAKKKTSVSVDAQTLAENIVKGLQEKKGNKIVMMDLRGVKGAIVDFFVICTGTSDAHVDALKESVEEYVFKQLGQLPWKKEGLQHKEWILLDYVDVVVHIFQQHRRDFYGIEELWGDARFV
ncbi:MAG: ribosome silencing factor, partial [Flammeovirgaceae bacterium]|nr:ribosome silencing factor [Flammeovirgaceae bacterium]MDW8287976.1 ribosome silencing factor [Flammeovirgaceae bacterium]